MKKLLFSLLLFSGIAYGQYPSVLVDLRNDPDATELQINDLQQKQVNLGFDFPLYDQTFSDVWVTYTGVLNFQETTNGGSFCCNGRDMDDPQFQQQAANGQYQHLNYSILAMWTDLHVEYNANPWYKTNSSNATFGWYDIPEFGGTTNLNSFEVKIFDSGDIKFRYDEVNIQNHAVTVGVTGNLEIGDYAQFKFKSQANGWQSDVPKVWTFNTLTGVFEDQYGDLTNFGAYVPPVFEDPCDIDPDSCGIFDPVSNFNSDFDVPGDSIYDFVPDTVFYTPDTYTDQDQFNNDYDAMTQMADNFGIDEYYDSLPDFDAQQDEFNQQFEEQGYVEPTGGYEEPPPFTEDVQEFFEENFQLESFDDIPGDFEDFPMAGPGMEEEFIEAFEDLAEDIIDVVLEEDIFEEEFIEEDIFQEEFVQAAFTEELFDEEITHEEVVMSKNEEDLLVSENTPESVNNPKEQSGSDNTVAQTSAARRIDAVSIAMNQIQETESTLDQSQQISEDTVLNEGTYSNQEYSSSSIADNMPIDFQESNTFEVNRPQESADVGLNQPQESADVGSVDAINYVANQLQESTTLDQSQQISEDTVLNEDTYNQEYFNSSMGDNMPLDSQESNTFEVSQPQESADVDSIDAINYVVSQLQESTALDQSQQISEDTVLNEGTYSNQEYSSSSIADNMPIDFQESNTFEVNQPQESADVGSVDAINYVANQLQESTTFVETAFVVSNLPEETHETLLQEIETYETLLQEIETQELSEFGGIAEITEESIIEELLDQNSGSDSGGMDFSMGDTGQTFSDGQSAFGDDTSFDFSFGGPSVVFTATTIESTTQQSDTQEVIDTSSSTTTTVDQNFDSQTDQAFSSGGSISDALTATAPPDFSRFNVAPPSQEEQQTTQKADAQANNMSEEQLEQNLDEFASNMQDSGGFTDQSLTVFLMGRNSGFSQYAGQLQDVSFYTDRGMPGGKMSNDRNSMLQLIGTNGKHEEMIAEQYK
jgi:hypothetical protein